VNNTTNEMSPAAQAALRQIRALRKLPEASSTIAAERKTIKNLNSVDVTAVALALDADDQAYEERSQR
jgi:hypothetical protein